MRTGWLLFTLDRVKEPFFDELGIGDREFNRALGRASYAAIWSLVADAPNEATVVVDAWFGFQPIEILEGHLMRAGVGATAEVWCHASNEAVVAATRRGLVSVILDIPVPPIFRSWSPSTSKRSLSGAVRSSTSTLPKRTI